MAGSQIPTSVSIIDNLHGFLALSLTEYNTSAAAAIAAGSVAEVAGAFFTFASDETPTGWSSVVTATTGYIALTASGTAGSQVVNANYTSTAPTWRDDLQGWYASAASSVRIVASVYKAESTSYYPKFIMSVAQNGSQRNINVNTASVASSLSVGEVASISSSLSVGGKLYPTGIVPVSSFCGNAVTRGSVFTALDGYIPVTSNTILVSGGFTTGIEIFVLSYAVRKDSTTIDIYAACNSGSGALSFVSGSGSTGKICIAW